MKHIRYLIEALALYSLYLAFMLLPLDGASAFGGWLARSIGPRMGASRKALKHIDMALPGLSDARKQQAIVDMWDNLGRVVGEYPHLEKIAHERITIQGEDIIHRVIETGKPAIFIAAHLGNWEVSGAVMQEYFKKDMELTYRAPNNPWADRLLTHARTLGGKITAHPKSRDSARHIVAALKNDRYLGILIDQKYNEGVAVPFFDTPAMTNPIFVQLAQKFECPVVPVRVERTKGAHFILHVHDPLPLFTPAGQALPVDKVIENTHMLLEQWIRDKPGQWLWLHRRWDSKKLDGKA